MACLDRSYRPYRGRAARGRDCDVSRIPGSGLAYHPYTLGGGPGKRRARDAPIGELGHGPCRAETRQLPRRLPCGSPSSATRRPARPLFAFADARGRVHGRERMARLPQPARPSYSQYTLRDAAPRPGAHLFQRWSTWQSGLRFGNGKPKPAVYGAFRLPFLVRLLGPGRGRTVRRRAHRLGLFATIEAKAPGGRYRSIASIPVNEAGFSGRSCG